jgi:hypothetical protein
LHLDSLSRLPDRQYPTPKLHTQRRFRPAVEEAVVGEPDEEGRLADARVADDYIFENTEIL